MYDRTVHTFSAGEYNTCALWDLSDEEQACALSPAVLSLSVSLSRSRAHSLPLARSLFLSLSLLLSLSLYISLARSLSLSLRTLGFVQ